MKSCGGFPPIMNSKRSIKKNISDTFYYNSKTREVTCDYLSTL